MHNTVWLTLLDQVNGADPAVFQAVTLALYFLVVDDGELEGRGGGSERGGGEGTIDMPVDHSKKIGTVIPTSL